MKIPVYTKEISAGIIFALLGLRLAGLLYEKRVK